ncbi:putative cytochrome c assembly protein [Dioscorea sansibarensis]
MVNDARKYDAIELCNSFMRIIIISRSFSYYISKKHGYFCKRKNLLIKSFFFAETEYLNKKRGVFKNTSFLSFRNYYKYQLTQRLDYWTYRIISLGFIFLTMGILSGAVWANEAWGSYWNWDPKETWAFITWTIFAIYSHIRININFQGTNPALVASIGFLIIWICYLWDQSIRNRST